MRILPKGSRYDVGSMSRLDALCRKVRDRPIGRDEKSAFYEFILAFKADTVIRPCLLCANYHQQKSLSFLIMVRAVVTFSKVQSLY
jgi:hypothetical protein